MSHRLLLLWTIFYGVLWRSSNAITKSFVNSSMPDMRPTFVVNFDTGTVICQHSPNPDDLHLHQISIICDGKPDCYSNPAMHDESFPYCGTFRILIKFHNTERVQNSVEFIKTYLVKIFLLKIFSK